MSEQPSPPPELLALLQARASFVLALHKGPDGDALGAGLALYLALTARGKAVQLVAPTELARHYQWLPQATALRRQIEGEPEVALFLDCDGSDRTGELEARLLSVPTVVQIDHHQGEPFGALQYVDHTAAATALLVLRVFKALQWPVTPDIAVCLYTGIATDTGFFRFENTNTEALEAAAELVALGVKPAPVAEHVSEARPLNRFRLLGRALDHLQATPDGRIVWTVLRPEDYAATGSTVGDTEGIIDTLKQVEGQRVTVVLKAPEDDYHWQASLRSPVVEVAAVARQFGGGGHARAAGFDAEGTLDEVLSRLLVTLEQALAEL